MDAWHPLLPAEVSTSGPARHSHDGDPALTMRDRCHAHLSDQDIDIILLFLRGRFRIGARAAAKLPRCGRFCRAVYAPLTIKGRSSAIDLRELTMRISGPYGPTLGSAASSVRRSSSSGFALPDAAS